MANLSAYCGLPTHVPHNAGRGPRFLASLGEQIDRRNDRLGHPVVSGGMSGTRSKDEL